MNDKRTYANVKAEIDYLYTLASDLEGFSRRVIEQAESIEAAFEEYKEAVDSLASNTKE